MPRFAANISTLFTELPFPARFKAAADAGFKGVEFHFPYDYSAMDLSERLREHGLEQVLFNLPPGDWRAGERGIACQPTRRTEFREGVDLALEYARTLGCVRLNCLAGIRPAKVNEHQARETLVENLEYAANRLSAADVKLLLEPINTRDMPGFYVHNSSQALALFDQVPSDNLWLQYDIYHMQIMEGDLARTMEDNLSRIAHIQLADNPGRHEPGTGEINFPFLFRHLDRIGYQGWIGAEYKPAAGTTEGLGWR